MVGTGGLSHQMIGERAGFNDEAWDREFLDLIERDPERLASMTIEDFMRRGGNEGAEVIMWLIMRGALDEHAKKLHQNYYLPMTTAMAVALLSEVRLRPGAQRARVAPQPVPAWPDAGREAQALPRKPGASHAGAVSEEEKDMVRRLDWKAMQDYGASFFCLEKLARTKGVSNPEMVAHFRGETLEQFLKTRRVPGAR